MSQTHPSKKEKVWIYVEGRDDKKLFGTIFHKDKTELTATNGITSVTLIVNSLLQYSCNNVVGIIDADFIRLDNIRNQNPNPNIFLTDNHDAEMMLIQNETVFRKITWTYLEDIDTNIHFDYIDFRKKILESLVWFSLIRLYNHIHDLALIVENFPIHECIDFQKNDISFVVQKRKCITLVNQKSENKKQAVKEEDIDQMNFTTSDYWNLCNGHDFLKVWAKSLQILTRQNINDKKLHHDLCLVFNPDIFKETQLYAQLKEWEERFSLSLF
ncbi:MAG: DUF4435 domain-containing protein [Planctomycetaceae bacterium]|jgi:hypothetical protein|nr:DUF4435 domain-containing protein [Planctomycetaceae bacterium]